MVENKKDVDTPDKRGHDGGEGSAPKEVALFADTFNRYFERENLDAALAVLRAPAAIWFTSQRLPTNQNARCAAARTFSPSARSMRRGARRNARWPRLHPMSRAASSSSALSQAAS